MKNAARSVKSRVGSIVATLALLAATAVAFAPAAQACSVFATNPWQVGSDSNGLVKADAGRIDCSGNSVGVQAKLQRKWGFIWQNKSTYTGQARNYSVTLSAGCANAHWRAKSTTTSGQSTTSNEVKRCS